MKEKEIHEFCMQLAEKGIERYNTDNGYTIIKDSAISREIQKARYELANNLKSIEYPPSGKEWHFNDGTWTNNITELEKGE